MCTFTGDKQGDSNTQNSLQKLSPSPVPPKCILNICGAAFVET